MGFGRFLLLRQRHIMNLAQSLQLKCHREPFRDKNSQRGPQFSARWVTEPCQGLEGGRFFDCMGFFYYLYYYLYYSGIYFVYYCGLFGILFCFCIMFLYYVLVFFIWSRYRIWYLVIIEWLKTGTGIGFLNNCA